MGSKFSNLWMLSPTGSNSFSAVDDWEKRSMSTWACSKCKAVKPGTSAIEAVIQKTKFRGDLSFIYWFSGFLLISTRLINALGARRVARHFYVGEVFQDDGTGLETHKTILPKGERLVTRGGPNSECNVCSKCGFIGYRAIGEQYLLRPRKVEPLSGDDEMFCRDDVYQQLAGLRLNRVNVKRIQFRDKPEDGLPMDLHRLPKGFMRVMRKGGMHTSGN